MISSKHTIRNVARALGLAAIIMVNNPIHAQNGEAIFKQNCAACHSVGKGRLVGPDLQGVTNKRSEEWLSKFIKSSQGLIKSGDADAKAVFEEFNKIAMPDQNLPDGDIKAILAFISSKSPVVAETPVAVEETGSTGEEKEEKSSKDATKEDILAGQHLFSGKVRFLNKGAACLSCHNVDYDDIMGGGTLAKDLTSAHENMGDAGIKGILSSPPFPAMTISYKDKSLTEDEIFKLTAFLSHVNKEKIYQHHTKYEPYFLYGGGFGVLILLSLIYFIWMDRKRRGVKEKIFNRQTKTQ